MDKKTGSQSQRREETDKRILEAAISIFGSRGYDRATIREIAEKAGVTAGLIVQRFDSKIGLMIRTLQYAFQFQTMPEPENCHMPEIMYHMLRMEIDLSQHNPVLFDFYTLIGKGIGLPAEIDHYLRESFEMNPVCHAIREAQEAGRMPKGDAYDYYRVFMSNACNLLVNYKKYDLPLPPREHFLSSIQYTYDAMKKEEQLEEDRTDFIRAASYVYPTVIYTNLTENTMRFSIANGESTPEMSADVAMQWVYPTLPDEKEREEFRQLFSVDNLLAAYDRGEKTAIYRHRQTDNRGEVHWKETMTVLSKNRRDDVTSITLIRNIDREVQAQIEIEKNREAAEQANRAKSSFLFNMSHDIRTPMNAIIGYADLMERHGDDAEKRAEYIRNIRISGQYLQDLINDILELSRIESGKATVDEEATDLWELQKSVAVVFDDIYLRKNLTVTRDYDIPTPYVFCDATKLRQVLLNIISNAAKYTPDGGSIHMQIRMTPDEKEGYMMGEYVLRDTGIGMSKEFLPHLFDSFSREKTVTENKIVGSGLGMGIVKKMSELMGGTVEVASELGVGTTVTVRIPFRVAESLIPEKRVDAVQSTMDLNGIRILMAEDNRMNREIAEELLTEQGCLVESVENGIACVGAVERAPMGTYDVILMDIQMPLMNGYQATEHIRQLPNGRSIIPIIAMTANVFDEDRKRAKASGMDGFAGKPLNMEQLSGEILRVIRR